MERVVLDLKILEDMPPGTIFATGLTTDNPGIGINMTNSGEELRWVACRGHGPADWAIYCQFSSWSAERIKKAGDKVSFEEHIRKLVPCDNDALAHYRQ